MEGLLFLGWLIYLLIYLFIYFFLGGGGGLTCIIGILRYDKNNFGLDVSALAMKESTSFLVVKHFESRKIRRIKGEFAKHSCTKKNSLG